ncbi:SMC-Scp complex subunit ScpB [Nakamurella silvestris]|nr:SMC-Scp complex subunit ScpB [Nakamurella silvestris]
MSEQEALVNGAARAAEDTSSDLAPGTAGTEADLLVSEGAPEDGPEGIDADAPEDAHLAAADLDDADLDDTEEPPVLDGTIVFEDDLPSALESVLLVVDTPVTERALGAAVGYPEFRVREELVRLAARYTEAGSGIDLREAGGGWRFYTRDRFASVVERFVLDGQQSRLSRAALESLAVIAYRQPVTRARISAVRGVNVDGVIRTLAARGLIEEVGTDVDTGGLLYRTTELFLERLGLNSLEDLPALGPLLPEIDAIDDV